MRTFLVNANVLDCVHPTPIDGATVILEGPRIAAVLPGHGTQAEANRPGPGDEVIDLKGAWLLPGLWDVHVHPDYHSLADMPLADQVTLFGHRLMTALTESGMVGFRCAGAHHFMDVAWKRAFEARGAAPFLSRPVTDTRRRSGSSRGWASR